jgi:hypothetical protein
VWARGERTDPRAHTARALRGRAEAHDDPALRRVFERMVRWVRDPQGEARRSHVGKAAQRSLAEIERESDTRDG